MIVKKKYQLIKNNSPFRLYFKLIRVIPKFIRPYLIAKMFPENPVRDFDLYISLGNNCMSARTLRRLKLRTFSFPFDWLAGVPLLTNLSWILQSFDGFLEYKDLDFPEKLEGKEKHLKVKNRRTNTFFIHDFLSHSPDEFSTIKEKYKRRCDRLLTICKNKEVLFLFIEGNDDNINYPEISEKIFDTLVLVKNKLQASKISLILLHFSNSPSDNKINVIQKGNCTLYLFASAKLRPLHIKGRQELALQVQEILQTIKTDTNECHPHYHENPLKS